MAEPLSTTDSARLIEFARACKAAARVVVLYPGGHPSIATTLGRIVQLTAADQLSSPLRISVLADSLLLDGRPLGRTDAAISELAALLHAHLVGELVIHAGGDLEAWRQFLLLVGRPHDDVRADGGLAKLWAAASGAHVEIREIDYADVLRDRQGSSAGWNAIIASCLNGDRVSIDALSEETVRSLLEAADDSGKLRDLLAAFDASAAEGGVGMSARAAALMQLLQVIVEAVKARRPEALEAVMNRLSTAAGGLSPEMMISLMSAAGGGDSGDSGTTAGVAPAGSDTVAEVLDGMSDATIAKFVSRNAMSSDTSVERVAQAFQSLVQDEERRERLLSLAHDDLKNSPLGATENFEDSWDQVAQKMMTSYSDKPFVSEAYARELTRARTQAVQVEQVHDDPPDRVDTWKASLATNELRALDLALITDLLRIEERHDAWAKLMGPVVDLLADLLLVGDVEAAETLVATLVANSRPEMAADRRQASRAAIDRLVAGPMMPHVVTHLATIEDERFERVKAMCVSVGDALIGRLTEALSVEERARTRERLTAILIAFGPSARREVERLRASANPAVRRTAIFLMREFGGKDALANLTELLKDKDQQVQRDAVRAIANLGTPEAFNIIETAITGGPPAARDALMQNLTSARDERIAAFFAHLLGAIDHRGALSSVYLKSIEALGALKDPAGIPALKDALYRGEWWAPSRTSKLRGAAAAALARIGTPAAAEVLVEATASGPRGVKAVARAHAEAARRTSPVGGRP